VVAVKDGQSGIEAIQQDKFDVVIVDIFMPGMDGLESIRAFKRHAPSVPVIAISGFMFRDSSRPAPDFLAMATNLGAASLLSPPPARPAPGVAGGGRAPPPPRGPPPPAAPSRAPANAPDAPPAPSSDSGIIAMTPAAPLVSPATPEPHVIAAAAVEPEIMAA